MVAGEASTAGSGTSRPGPEAEFAAYLAAGRFMIQRAPDGTYVFYPRVAAPGTGAPLEWVEASGHGTVHAITVNRAREGAYNVALIDLAEGPRLMSTVEGVESVPIGTPVRARIRQGGEGHYVVFDPAPAP